MSPNGGWRYTKIVIPSPSRAKEIAGGIKNALNRGESLVKAKQSFINSGYSPQEVQEATQFVYSSQTQAATQQAPAQVPKSSSSLSKKSIIILLAVGISILIIATLLGLFWNKIF